MKAKNIVNLTPHDVVIYDQSGKNIIMQIPPTAPAARVQSETLVIDDIDGVPVTCIKYGKVENLPEPREGTVYIVSMLVQQALPQRTDLLRPDTSPQNVVRDAAGQILGVKALAAL
jgi:hypothetical protein